MRGSSVVLDALFPRACVLCACEGTLLCAECLAGASLDGPPFAYANPMVRQLICAWKYDGDEEAIRALWQLVPTRLASLRSRVIAEQIDAIVPVPLSAWKERWRGFHQGRNLARMLGAELLLPVTDVLERAHRPSAQANLSKATRADAVDSKIFSLKKGAELPHRVLLIDDVETTGATMNAVEEVLKCAGVEFVMRWSLARG